MKKQTFAKFARKSVAAVAAVALSLSMFGCATVQPQSNDRPHYAVELEDDGVALDDGEGVADNNVLTIKAGPAVQDTDGSWTWPKLEVHAQDPTKPIYSITVQFTSKITDTDAITLNAATGFVPFAGNKKGNGSVNATNGATPAQWEEYLRKNLSIKLAAQTKTTSLRMIASYKPVEATYDFWEGNGHYYRYVGVPGAANTSTIAWTEAYDAAKNSTYMGMQGYLVTVTSQAEQDFICSLIKSRTWIGGTCDPAYTGVANSHAKNQTHVEYRWVSGPESGKVLYSGDRYNNSGFNSSASTNGTFAAMCANQPDNANSVGLSARSGGSDVGELYLHLYEDGRWNDYPNWPCYNGHYVQGYIIEYGDMPEDDNNTNTNVDVDVNVDVTVKIDIKLDVDKKTLTTDVNDVEVGEKLSIKENVNGDENVLLYEMDGNKVKVGEDGQPVVKKDANGKDTPSPVTRTFQKQKADGTWEDIQGEPVHAGTYKVISTAVYCGEGADAINYTPGEATFKIKPKTVVPTFTKVYDGTDAVTDNLADIDLKGLVLDDANVTLAATGATYKSLAVGANNEVYLTGAALSGTDAGDYVLPAAKDGKVTVKGSITPRPLTVTATATVNWGLEHKALKDGSDKAIEYKNDLGVHKNGDANWPENQLAERDAKADLSETILGAATYTELSGSTALDAGNPLRGTYNVEVHFAKVNPAGASAADNDKGTGTLSMMAEEGEVVEQTEVQPNAAAPTAPAAGALDNITVTKTDDGKYDLGNYILTLVNDKVLITDNPLKENGFDDATNFLAGNVSEKVDPDAKPLTDDEILAFIEQVGKGDIPDGVKPVIVITDKDGKVVTEIDRNKIGSYAIVATYPNPDGKDTVVRVGYNVLENDPIVKKQSISVKAHEGAKPTTKDNLKKVVENIMDDWLPKGVDPSVIITDKDGKQVSEIPMDKPGEYKVTLTYIDDDGVVRQVEVDYKVDPDQIEEIKEDISKPIHDGEPMTKDDVIKDIVERYSPEIIPEGAKDFEVTIEGPNGPVEKIDPSVPGTYTVTMTYTDAEGNKHTVKTTYTFFDPNEGMGSKVGDTDPTNGDNDGDNNGVNNQAGGTDPSTGSDFNSGASGYKGWDNNSGSKGFADRLLAQTGDPVFWVICGVVVVAVVAGVVLVVARKKNKKQQ